MFDVELENNKTRNPIRENPAHAIHNLLLVLLQKNPEILLCWKRLDNILGYLLGSFVVNHPPMYLR
jgi:hypothetical protein